MHPLSRIEDGRLLECAAIVVTYFPSPENLLSIAEKAKQVAATFIVDNASSPEIRAQIAKLAEANPTISIQFLPENFGLATGWNYGVKAARAAGYHWAFTFDQDTPAPADLAVKIAGALRDLKFPEKVGLFVPLHVHPVTRKPSAYSPVVRRRAGYSEISTTIHSGSIISLDANQAVGGFVDKLFIDYIDYEYGFRLLKNGYHLIQLDEVRLLHEVGERSGQKFFGIPVPMNNHSPLRHYYIARNRLYVVRHLGWRHPGWLMWEFFHGFLVLAVVAVTDPKGVACVKFALRGMKDAFRGHYGKLQT